MTVELTPSLLVPQSRPLGTPVPCAPVPSTVAPGQAPASVLDTPCAAADPELWFAETPQGVEEAKARCLPCPLRERCLAGALERQEPWGVWGGELLLRGVVVPRKRPRGRPRKNPVTEIAAVA